MKKNPIDKDKITENPHNLPYAHHIGSVQIKPIDKGKVKGNALSAMYQQTEHQMNQLKEQMQLIAEQAKRLQQRVQISEKIYTSEMGFEPIIGHIYYVYQRKNGAYVLSMVGPSEWGKTMPYAISLAAVKLLSDHTWEVIEDYDGIIDIQNNEA